MKQIDSTSASGEIATTAGGWRRWLGEPLLHFLLLGAGLFLVYSLIAPNRASDDVIVIDETVTADLIRQYSSAWGRPPNDDEMRALLDAYIEEELYYRKGLALGLAENDPVIKRRMRQKVSVIAEQSGGGGKDGETLESWFAAHRDDYRQPPQLAFEQVYFDPGKYGDQLDAIIGAALRRLKDGGGANNIGDISLLPVKTKLETADLIARDFGEQFAGAIADLPVGQWSGPVQSGLGLHLVKITERVPGSPAQLDDVRATVERDYESASRKRKAAAYTAELLREYKVKLTVDLPDKAIPAAARK